MKVDNPIQNEASPSEVNPLPKRDWEIKLRAIANLVIAREELNKAYSGFLKAHADDIRRLANPTIFSPDPRRYHKLVEFGENQVKQLENIDEIRVQKKYMLDMNVNYTHVWLPEYERMIKECLEHWDELTTQIEANAQVKEIMDRELKDSGMDISDDEVKLRYSNRAKILLLQMPTSAVPTN